MTQKELLYLEDAIKHEEIIIDVLNFMVEEANSDDLSAFCEKEIKTHEKMKEKLNNLLEEKANE